MLISPDRHAVKWEGPVPEETEPHQPQGQTRRSFLTKLSLGLAALAGSGFLLRNFLLPGEKGGADQGDEFPGEDSIFHPRKDPRLEAQKRHET